MELPPNIIDAIYECRVLILLESAPQSNTYHQIMLTRDQFRLVSETIRKQMPLCSDTNHSHGPQGHFAVPIKQSVPIVIKDEISSYYPVEEIKPIS